METKVKVYAASIDGECGTLAGAYKTEQRAYEFVVQNVGLSDEDGEVDHALKLVAENKLGELQDYLEDNAENLTTWNVEECEVSVDVPDLYELHGVASKLAQWLRNVRALNERDVIEGGFSDGFNLTEAEAILEKYKPAEPIKPEAPQLVHSLNTGRSYTAHGQLIVWTVLEDKTVFYDYSRMIAGTVTEVCNFGETLLRHYDNNNYRGLQGDDEYDARLVLANEAKKIIEVYNHDV